MCAIETGDSIEAAAAEIARAAKRRRDIVLVLSISSSSNDVLSGPNPHFHLVVGTGYAFSTSRKTIFLLRIEATMSNLPGRKRHTSGGWPMTTDDVMVDVSQDWFQACDVQEHFMRSPARNNGLVDFSACCRQMRALGGDCYDFTSLADGQLAMLVGDASGKGLAAALMMASVQASLRTASVFTGNELSALLRVVNLQVCASSLHGRYATLFYGVLDRVARTLRYVNAGHNPPLVLRHNGSLGWLEPGGGPVGLFPDAMWEERLVQLYPGDVVITYTDGVTEAIGTSGEEWGVDGLLQAATARRILSADALVRSVLDSMDEFSGGVPTDDVTVAVLRVL